MNKKLTAYKNINRPLQFIAMGLFLFFFSACNGAPGLSQNATSQHTDYYSILPQDKNTSITEDFMHIKLLGSLRINHVSVNSLNVTELSGLAWDEDEQLLYAISDEGLLYHIRIIIKDGKLKAAEVVFATSLKDRSGKALKGKNSDSEGLSIINNNNGIKGDSQLIISFENKPRIAYYTLKGKLIRKIKIPKKLSKRKYYRSKNKALESVANHPQYGVLTAAEYPLKKDPKTYQTLYSNRGEVWHFPASRAINSAITGLEVMPDGDVLVLERAYKNPIIPIRINLRRLKLDQCNKQRECKTQVIASFNGADGWLLDNFEGLTHFQGNKYLMVSDDNKNPLQKTILVLFEIKITE